MRLSNAMMLPCDVPFNPNKYLWESGGCLLGQAMNAATGVKNCSLQKIIQEWPWLQQTFEAPALIDGLILTLRFTPPIFGHASGEQIITYLAFLVEKGKITREQAADWVRSVEPPDPSELSDPTEEMRIDQTELILSDVAL